MLPQRHFDLPFTPFFSFPEEQRGVAQLTLAPRPNKSATNWRPAATEDYSSLFWLQCDSRKIEGLWCFCFVLGNRKNKYSPASPNVQGLATDLGFRDCFLLFIFFLDADAREEVTDCSTNAIKHIEGRQPMT